MLTSAILTILIQYPGMICGNAPCTAYQVCDVRIESTVFTTQQASDAALEACDEILGWDGDEYE